MLGAPLIYDIQLNYDLAAALLRLPAHNIGEVAQTANSIGNMIDY